MNMCWSVIFFCLSLCYHYIVFQIVHKNTLSSFTVIYKKKDAVGSSTPVPKMSSPAVSAGQLAGRVEHKRFSETRTFSRYGTVLLHRFFTVSLWWWVFKKRIHIKSLYNIFTFTKFVHNCLYSVSLLDFTWRHFRRFGSIVSSCF